jgi:GDP-D-mannose dehydratase
MKRRLLEVVPDYLFNLAAQSHVQYSWNIPDITMKTNFEAYKNIISIIKEHKAL